MTVVGAVVCMTLTIGPVGAALPDPRRLRSGEYQTRSLGPPGEVSQHAVSGCSSTVRVRAKQETPASVLYGIRSPGANYLAKGSTILQIHTSAAGLDSGRAAAISSA